MQAGAGEEWLCTRIRTTCARVMRKQPCVREGDGAVMTPEQQGVGGHWQSWIGCETERRVRKPL